jgi:hypothetical protein
MLQHRNCGITADALAYRLSHHFRFGAGFPLLAAFPASARTYSCATFTGTPTRFANPASCAAARIKRF